MKKRIFALLLALCLVASLLPAQMVTAEGTEGAVTDSTTTETTMETTTEPTTETTLAPAGSEETTTETTLAPAGSEETTTETTLAPAGSEETTTETTAAPSGDGEEVVPETTVAPTTDPAQVPVTISEVEPVYVAQVGDNKYETYETLQAAVDAANGGTVTLLTDTELSTMVTIPSGANVTLDLYGHTITGTDTTEKNFSLLDNRGTLKITSSAAGGKMTLKATINSGWNRYSAVVANNPGGNLTIESNVTLEHLGGTDMAYGIDNLTNGRGTSAVTTVNGGAIKSTYRAIRQFLNGVEATNTLTINGGTVEGANKAIFFHDPSKNANSGKLTIGKNAHINGGVYLYVTEGSTKWPVEVSVAAEALDEKRVIYANVPNGHTVANINGTYGVYTGVAVVDGTQYETLQAAVDAADGKTVTLLQNVALSDTVTVSAGKTVTIDLNGCNITGSPAKAKAYAVIDNKGTLTITGNGTILCNHTLAASTAYAVNTILNQGTLYVNGGVIENKSTASQQIGYAIDNNSTVANAVLKINGGTVRASGSEYYDGIRQFCNSEDHENSVTVTGGTVSSIWMQNPSDGGENKNTKDVMGSVAVSGGTVTGLYLEPSSKFTASVTGGNIGTLDYFQTAQGRDLTGFVTGGTFTNEPKAAFIAKGLKWENGKIVSSYVAQVGDKKFETLQEAVDAADGKTVTLLKDIPSAGATTVSAGKTVTIDLNGKTVSMVDNSSKTCAMINNNGNLTITDSTEAKSGKLTFKTTTPGGQTYASNTISNKGTLTIKAGTIENTSDGPACYALDCYAGSTATIEGGKLTASRTTARVFNWSETKATLNVTGGEIVSESGYAINLNMGKTPVVELNISGGTITTNDEEFNLAVYADMTDDPAYSAKDVKINITGGTFNGIVALNGKTSATMGAGNVSVSGGTMDKVHCYGSPAYRFVTGGTYKGDVREYCADGYACTLKDGVYKVDKQPTTPEETEPQETKPQETEPQETKPQETEPQETKPQETKPQETKPQVTEPQETEPQETNPPVTEPQETEPQETEPQETEPQETKPQETKPQETKPQETKPQETKPQETKPGKPAPTTGDDAKVIGLIAVLMTSGLMAAVLLVLRKKSRA